MKILMTGATGTVGRRLCAALRSDGHRLVALSRDPDRARAAIPALEHAYRWTADELPPLEAFDGVESVVHLAGETVTGRWSARKRRAIRDSRVRGTRHLIDALAASGARPESFISASAVGYYGDRGDEGLTEHHGPGDGFLAEVCREWEWEARRAADRADREVRLRIGIVLDPDGGALDAMLPAFRTGLGGRFGHGRQWWPWVHAHDLVRFIRYAVEHPISGPFNVVSPRPARQKELAAELGGVLRRPAVLPLPGLALKVALGGFATELLMSRRVLPTRAEESGFRFHYRDLSTALADLVGAESGAPARDLRGTA